MIYTVTFNPSLDYVIGAEKLEPGKINRTTRENIYPGGKGNNVSVVLSNLGHKSKALGFVSGFTGEALEKMLDDFGCYTDFIQLDNGFTRINVKISAGEETEINGQGPRISEEAIGKLYEKLDALTKGDVLVLAGSIPNTLPEDIYERIMARLDGRGIRIVVDATKDLLMNVLKYHPFLIKPNNHGRPPKGEVLNSVGAGDSMVAGFVTGYLNTGDYEKAFELGIATGSASAFEYWLAEKEDVVKLLEKEPELYGL